MEEDNNDIINYYTHSLAENAVDMMQKIKMKLWAIIGLLFGFNKMAELVMRANGKIHLLCNIYNFLRSNTAPSTTKNSEKM